MSVERAGISDGRPPFNDKSERVVISRQDRIIGPKALKLFRTEIIRSLPWDIKGDRIEVAETPLHVAEMELGGRREPFTGELRPYTIVTEGLEKETISLELATVLAQFKAIEDYLPDFTKEAIDKFRTNIGISAAYAQWTREELQHSLAIGLILRATGHRTDEQLAEEQIAALEQTWQGPHPSGREIILYAAMQELQTRDAYFTLSDRAQAEDAPIIAKILKRIGRDEAYHGNGYIKFSKLFYDEDPDGTVADALHVAATFKMPALNLLPNQRQALRSAIQIGVYGSDMGQETIIKTLKGLGFLPEDRIKEASDIYGHSQDRLRHMYERFHVDPRSGILLPGRSF